jgi:hypothetical protein
MVSRLIVLIQAESRLRSQQGQSARLSAVVVILDCTFTKLASRGSIQAFGLCIRTTRPNLSHDIALSGDDESLTRIALGVSRLKRFVDLIVCCAASY